MSVRAILKAKGDAVPTVSSEVNVRDVLQRLEEEDVGALVVTDDGMRIKGIISERDIVRGLRTTGDDVLDADVGELMTTDVVTCKADDKIAAVMAMMSANRIRHLPVVDGAKLAGFISIRDIIEHRLNEVQADADAMQRYISG